MSNDSGTPAIMRWFDGSHLKDERTRLLVRAFEETAEQVLDSTTSGPEQNTSLRKLLEAKDAAVRAQLEDGGVQRHEAPRGRQEAALAQNQDPRWWEHPTDVGTHEAPDGPMIQEGDQG